MDKNDPRRVLENLARQRGDDYSALSRLIGRNTAYIQQFIKRGTPKRLAERDRRVLAEYFGVEEALLGALPDRKNPSSGGLEGDLVTISQYAVGASAGPGALTGEEEELSQLAFPRRWLRRMADGDPGQLSIITVDGDSMEPSLSDGDEILVNRGDAADRLRDGIYVLRQDDALIVKRIAMNPATRRFTIKSDNPDYEDYPDCGSEDVDVIGRVVWTGRRIA